MTPVVALRHDYQPDPEGRLYVPLAGVEVRECRHQYKDDSWGEWGPVCTGVTPHSHDDWDDIEVRTRIVPPSIPEATMPCPECGGKGILPGGFYLNGLPADTVNCPTCGGEGTVPLPWLHVGERLDFERWLKVRPAEARRTAGLWRSGPPTPLEVQNGSDPRSSDGPVICLHWRDPHPRTVLNIDGLNTVDLTDVLPPSTLKVGMKVLAFTDVQPCDPPVTEAVCFGETLTTVDHVSCTCGLDVDAERGTDAYRIAVDHAVPLSVPSGIPTVVEIP